MRLRRRTCSELCLFNILVQVAVCVLTVSSSEDLGISRQNEPEVINVRLYDNGHLSWDGWQTYSHTEASAILYYQVLVYKPGQREKASPVQVEGTYFDLKSLNLAAGTYHIEIRAVSSTRRGPYSNPTSYSVEDNETYQLIAILTVATILALGLVLGSAAFSVVMWKLRWRREENRRRNTRTLQEANKRTAASSSNRRIDEDPSVTMSKNTACRCAVLGNSTTELLHQGNTQEDVYESITECVDHEYSVLETQERYSNYVTDSEIEAPTSFVHMGPAVPANGEESRVSLGVTRENYLELMPPSAAVRGKNTHNEHISA